MDDKSLIDTFAALAQPTRLEAFRLLVSIRLLSSIYPE
jgi:hypothetical protein